MAATTTPRTAPRRAGASPQRARGATRFPRTSTPWLFLLVPLVLLLVFTYLPMVNLLRYSMLDWDGLSRHPDFVGIENFVEIFTRPELFRVLAVSLYYLGASVVQIVLALYFATILSFKVRFANLFKGILFFPYLINAVAIGFMFLYVFRPGGVLDTVLALFGAGGLSHQWLGDPGMVNYSLAAVSVWRYLGLNFVLFLGAIQSIPGELFEAAEIDGANRWHQFRYIILPGIRPVIGLMSILSISGSLSVFEIPYIMTQGANGSETFVIQTLNLAFKFNHVGLASAMALVLVAIVLLITWLQRRIVPEERVTP
jgi:raffinose/stachyose/melibiose transport system permease protein